MDAHIDHEKRKIAFNAYLSVEKTKPNANNVIITVMTIIDE